MKRRRFNFWKISLFLLAACLIGPPLYRWDKTFTIRSDLRWLRAKPDQTTPEEMQDRINHLESGGPEALQYIMDDLKSGSSWDRRTSRYLEILKKMGKPAHEALIEAVQSSRSPFGRFKCTFFMQGLFDDYSKFDVCVTALVDPSMLNDPRIRKESVEELRFQLSHRFPDAPDEICDVSDKTCEVTPEFRHWLEVHSQPGGPLPKIQLPKT